jgi:hypothetical protein
MAVGEDDFFLDRRPLMWAAQKSKQLDGALKVYNSLSFLEIREAEEGQKRG